MKLVFIGMMGSGKSTVGKRIAADLGLDCISIDQEIEKRLKMSIVEIFQTHGEPYFREYETKVLEELSKRENLVLDCGGGIILSEHNMQILQSNQFKIVYLNRTIENIMTDICLDTRPLLKSNPQEIYTIFDKRKDLYDKYADIVVENSGLFEDVYTEILNYFTNGQNNTGTIYRK